MTELEHVTVTRTYERKNMTCSLGELHEVRLVEERVLTLTDETWKCDNGYEVSTQPVYQDAEGTRYRRYVTIDYFKNTSYLSDEGHWYTGGVGTLAKIYYCGGSKDDIGSTHAPHRDPGSRWCCGRPQ